MVKEVKLVNKVKCLLRHLGCPRWLHHFGPKTYEFVEYLCALLMRAFCKLSYRRVKQLFDLLGKRCPSKSALQYTAAKLDSGFWQRILQITSGQAYPVAIDSTCLSRTNPSYRYLKRIDRKIPKVPIKVSVAFDTRKKKYCGAKIRVLPAHDIRDAIPLLKKTKPKVFVADKAYDANSIQEYCKKHKIKAHIPIRNKGKVRHNNMSTRRLAAKHFNIKTYHRREIVESGNSSNKRKYGSSVSSKTVRTIRTEVYGKLTCHNLFSWLTRLLGQSLLNHNLYKPTFVFCNNCIHCQSWSNACFCRCGGRLFNECRQN